MKNQFNIVFKKELKLVTRSASSLFLSIIMPLIILPIFLTLLIRNSSSLSIESKTNNPKIALYINNEKEKVNITNNNTSIYDKQFNVINNFIFKDISPIYIETINEREFFASGKIDVSVTFDENIINNIDSGRSKVIIVYDDGNNTSYSCAYKIANLINEYSAMISEIRLNNISSSLEEISAVDLSLTTIQKASENKKIEGLNDSFLNNLVPTFLSIFLAFGSIAVTSEMFVSEKEKNTLESLFSTGVNRKVILKAKISVSLLFSFISLLMEFLGFLFAILINYKFFSLSAIYFNPSSIILICFTLLSVPLFLSILAIAVFIFSKNNKNAMALITTIQFIPIITSLLLLFVNNNIMNNLVFMFIPIIGSLFAFKLSIHGLVNALYLIISFLVNVTFSLLLLYLSFRRYNSEKILLD